MVRLDQTLQTLRALDAQAAGAAQTGQAGQFDPRALLLAALACIATVVSFERHTFTALLPLAAFPTVLAVRARLGWRTMGRTILLAMPWVLLLGLFNPLLERQTAVTLGGVAISGGWLSLVSMLLRAALAVGTTLALVGGTGMPALCNAMTRLRVPQALTLQLWLLYRCLFVLGAQAARMDTARRLRAGARPRMGLRTWAALLGHLLLRSVDQAQRLHQAMLARGFTGSLPGAPLRWRVADSVFLFGWCAYFALVRSVDLPAWIGHGLLRGLA